MRSSYFHSPLVLISVFLVLFVYLRYFFITSGMSGLVPANHELIFPSLAIYFILHICLLILHFIVPAGHHCISSTIDLRSEPLVEMYYIFGIISLISHTIITYFKFGTLGWFVTSEIDIWASLYILKIPIVFLQIITIHKIFQSRTHHNTLYLSGLLLFSIFSMGSRGALTTVLMLYFLYLFVFNKKVSLWAVLLSVLLITISILVLTLVKFAQISLISSISLLPSMLEKAELYEILFGVIYGRFYVFDSSILILENIQSQYYFNYSFFQMLYDNLIPGFINPDKLSITRLNCEIIAPGRWSDHTSCSVSFLFFLISDSGFLGLLYFSIFTVILWLVWTKLGISNNLLYKLIYLNFLPQLMFYLNWDIASINQIIYQILYLAPSALIYISLIKSKA